MSGMPKGEREDLQRLVRQREKVLKSTAKQRTADLIADFENQMGQQYAFDQDEVWSKAVEVAERDVRRMQKRSRRAARSWAFRSSSRHRSVSNGTIADTITWLQNGAPSFAAWP